MKLAILLAILLCQSGSGSFEQFRGWGAVQADCHSVKETCSRKKGCKCKLRCTKEGERLPPEGGKGECPSFCCEEKCECHPMGCP